MINELQKRIDHLTFLDSNDIFVPEIFPEDFDFWGDHGYDKENYLNLIKELNQFYLRILEDQELDYKNFLVDLFFNKEKAVKVWIHEGRLELAHDGMHRILAAQELNSVLPVLIINRK